MKKNGLSILLLAAILVLAVGSAWATDYYVATTGNDANVGSSGNPWKTIQHAVNTVSPSHVINVAGGDYTESLSITKPLTLQGAGATTARVTGTSSITVHISGADNVTVRGFTFKGAPGPGPGGSNNAYIMKLSSANDAVIEDNVLESLDGAGWGEIYGLEVDYSTGSSFKSITVRNIANCGTSEGVYLWHGITGNTFENLTVDGVSGSSLVYGLHLFSGSNNTFTGTVIRNITGGAVNDGIGLDPYAGNNVFTNTLIEDLSNTNPNWPAIGVHLDGCSNNYFTNTTIRRLSGYMSMGVLIDGDDWPSVNNTLSNTNIQDLTPSNNAWGIWVRSKLTGSGAAYGHVLDGVTISGLQAFLVNIVLLETTADCTIKNANIDLGGVTNSSGVRLKGTAGATVQNCTITGGQYGIFLDRSANNNTLTGNTVSSNTYGIYLTDEVDASSIFAHFNNIAGNTQYGLLNRGTEIVEADKNWWGHATGPSGEYGRVNNKGKVIGKGDAVSDNVDWDPWLPQSIRHTPHDPVPPGLLKPVVVSGSYSLGPACPNPANPSTQISYSIGQPGLVMLKIYNLKGQLVRTLVDEAKTAGNYTIRWDGRDNSGVQGASGVYFYRMIAGNYSQTRRMVILK